ncbi:MAG: hypothetical protein JW913_14870 [Chitinispirillaceae bacterium]|nr:hypothetical protein [Chitinispirillaceae bacterium]
MIKSLSDYQFLQCINNDGIISLYHARCHLNNTSFILKLPAYETIPEPAVSFLKNEYAICSKITSEQVITSIRFVRINNRCIVEYKNYDVIPLALSPDYGNLSPQAFLTTAISLTELLGRIHDVGIVHRNLSPLSFLKSISSGIHYLTGFYIAAIPDTSFNDKLMSSFLTRQKCSALARSICSKSVRA